MFMLVFQHNPYKRLSVGDLTCRVVRWSVPNQTQPNLVRPVPAIHDELGRGVGDHTNVATSLGFAIFGKYLNYSTILNCPYI